MTVARISATDCKAHESPMIGVCSKCDKLRRMTRHHVYPQRFFTSELIVLLCAPCHRKVEAEIPAKTKKKKEWYVNHLDNFLKR